MSDAGESGLTPRNFILQRAHDERATNPCRVHEWSLWSDPNDVLLHCDTCGALVEIPKPAAVGLLGELATKATRPVACCPNDGHPLVSTFEIVGKEWWCAACKGSFEWLSARNANPTDAIHAQLAESQARYRTERAEREKVATDG